MIEELKHIGNARRPADATRIEAAAAKRSRKAYPREQNAALSTDCNYTRHNPFYVAK